MIIDGKALAQKILDDLKKRVHTLEEKKHIQPHLAVLVVGDDPATAAYVRQKKKMGEQIGAVVSIYNYPKNVTENKLEESIDFLQKEGSLHGLIIQLPLPSQLNTDKLVKKVDADKDVDGFRADSAFNEPIAEAVVRILKEVFGLEQRKKSNKDNSHVIPSADGYRTAPVAAEESHSTVLNNSRGIDPSTSVGMTSFTKWLSSKKIVILGKGKTGGKPILRILQKMHIVPIVVDSKTQNPETIIKNADILICAVGNKGTLITKDSIKKDAILIGIGMHMGTDGKLHGDYETQDIEQKARYYTPIPGGVGPVNAAMLLANVVSAAENTMNKE